jgi:BMFP domain-containing protein YqiC
VDILDNFDSLACSESNGSDRNFFMSKPSQIMDDLAQLAGGAAGLVSGVQQQIKDDIKARVEEMATNLDLVPREDLDRVEAMLQQALNDQKDLKKRLDALEGK